MRINIWNRWGSPKNARHKTDQKSWQITTAQSSRSKTGCYDNEQVNNKNTGEVLLELDSLIGLHGVKKLIEEIHSYIKIQKIRQKEKLASDPLGLHMIFKGNPGTGKTTVARILGKLFKEVEVLPKGHLIEVERADLVGGYIGHTAQKTREQIKKALGGILFIDEAYSLARGGDKDFGKEAIDALVKGMEDHRESLILILAGYQEEMDWFVQTNPGLRSRFPIHITFPDFSNSELLAIADLMLEQRQYYLSNGAREEFRFALEKGHKHHVHSGNARLVRNLIERAIRRQAVRLLQNESELSRSDLMAIKREDLVGALDQI